MKIIRIPYKNQREAAHQAIEMSRWCRENGLEHGRNYDWALQTKEHEIHFRFYDDSESMATAFILIWSGHEV